jgi:BolA protein
MTKADTIAVKLKTALQADFIEVLDVSHEHAGHGGWREGGETHFKLTITSPQFAGKSRVQQHRMVNSLLADELANGVHALEMHLSVSS